MSDLSTFALFTAGLAVFAPLVAAHGKEPITVPGGSDPTAGAIFQPGLNAVVPAGGSFSVTWKPTEEGCGKKVDLVLLKGPSASAMAAYSYIAKGLNNNGSYAWSPSTSLEPSPEDYGIELICQETQAYQYSTRFGISNDKYVAGSDEEDHTSHATTKTGAASATGPKYPVGTGTATGGAGYVNGTLPSPTGALTVPSSLRTSTQAPSTTSTAPRTSAAATTSASASTGAAAAFQTGASGLFAAAALVALAL
ncbi:hypothetical protein CAC42_4174 [Sphaceloma murrayae]|uniref:Yeast cell wall synthesis Kre9/Knh1-like N-terminal domain-containing protein n=1 Tax=Sphaceloma murrayae TaxID=2082308 RepID=A0A2K1QL94_9PEZI|nr:hypothetical protein CAC42_4174 [Sphaceloma murrayae]